MMAELICPSCGHHVQPPPGEELTVGGLSLRTDTCIALGNGLPQRLPLQPCLLLAALMRYPGRTVASSYLMDAANMWGAPESLKTVICQLRYRIGHLVEIRPQIGIGYSIHPRTK